MEFYEFQMINKIHVYIKTWNNNDICICNKVFKNQIHQVFSILYKFFYTYTPITYLLYYIFSHHFFLHHINQDLFFIY